MYVFCRLKIFWFTERYDIKLQNGLARQRQSNRARACPVAGNMGQLERKIEKMKKIFYIQFSIFKYL